MPFQSPELQKQLEAAKLLDKARVIALFTEQGKMEEFEADHEVSLSEYLDEHGYMDDIFETVCDDYQIDY